MNSIRKVARLNRIPSRPRAQPHSKPLEDWAKKWVPAANIRRLPGKARPVLLLPEAPLSTRQASNVLATPSRLQWEDL